MENFLIIVILAIVLGAAIAYIVKSKKSGAQCIGCPAGGNCAKHKAEKTGGACCCCGGEDPEKKSAENSTCCCHSADEK